MMKRIAGALWVATALVLATPSVAAENAPLPKTLQRALDRAIAVGDPATIGQLVGGNPMLGARIVATAVAKRPELAARIAATAAGNVPQVAPQLAAAAAIADPAAAAAIAVAVSVAVPTARTAIVEAVVGTLPPNDRMAAAGKVHAAVDAVELPSVEDPD